MFVLLALVFVGLTVFHSLDTGYAADEDWAVHGALFRKAQARLPMLAFQNIVQYASDNIWLDGWIRLFGPSEAVTRWFSVLCLPMGLACLYRLGRDLWNERTALAAVVLLGGLAAFQHFGARALPYAPSLLVVVGLYLAFWRWVRCPSRRRVVLYGLFAGLLIYTYPFGVWLIAAQAAALPVLARWPRQRYVQAAILFGLTGLFGLVRLQAAYHPLSVDSYWHALDVTEAVIEVQSPEFGQVALLLGLAAAAGMVVTPLPGPVRCLFFGAVALLVVIAIGLGGALQRVFPLLPLLALLAAYTLSTLRWPVRGALLALYLFPTVFIDRTPVTGTTYQDVAAVLQADAGSKTVIAAPYLW